MSDTKENLGKAFAGESQANRKYLAFAKKAEAEGHPQVARLFRAVAGAETVHALNHLRVAGGVKSTKENLVVAIEGESYEHKEMYPAFIEQAKKDGNVQAVQSFSWANSVEKVHEGLYTKALEALEGGSELESKPMFVCGTCGYTIEGNAPDVCPVCGSPREKFKSVE